MYPSLLGSAVCHTFFQQQIIPTSQKFKTAQNHNSNMNQGFTCALYKQEREVRRKKRSKASLWSLVKIFSEKLSTCQRTVSNETWPGWSKTMQGKMASSQLCAKFLHTRLYPHEIAENLILNKIIKLSKPKIYLPLNDQTDQISMCYIFLSFHLFIF